MHRLSIILAASLPLLTSNVARAETTGPKAVITQNRDEPGRTPYQSSTGTFTSVSGSPLGFGMVSFAPVPAGMRLVVTYVSATFFTPSPLAGYAYLTDDQYSTATALPVQSNLSLSPSDPDVGDNVVIVTFGGPVNLYFEATRTPQLYVNVNVTGGPGVGYTLVGYLVSVP